MKPTTLAAAMAALIALPVLAAPAAAPGHSPYAGHERHEIKALSPAEVDDLLAGQGMGFAKAAELNGYPGPAHVLELADRLGLTPDQRHASAALMAEHRAAARELGARLVHAERALDLAFAERRIDRGRLAALTAEIGTLQAQLRAEHLGTHIAQTRLLSAEQVRRYAQLRGYAQAPPRAHPHRH